MELVHFQKPEQFAEAIFRFGHFVVLIGSERAALRVLLGRIALKKLVPEWKRVERRVRRLYGIGGRNRVRESFGGEIFERGLEVAEIAVRAHERTLACFSQRRGEAAGTRVIAF